MASKIVQNTDVLIVGGGPVGTTLNLLLNRCNVKNLLIEKRPSLSNKPRAHYISNRSMEVLRHLGHIDKLCQKIIPPLKHWRFIRYVKDISGTNVANRDCFSDYYTYLNTYYDHNSPSKIGNVGQNILSLLLNSINSDDISMLESDCEYKLPWQVKKKICDYPSFQNIHFGIQLIGIESITNDGIVAVVKSGKEIHKVNCKYLIGADGVHSLVKAYLGIQDNFNERYKNYYVAIHFKSKKLQQLQQNSPSMLKFICGKQIAVLVWYYDSEFVLHIPCLFEELQQKFDFDKCRKIVKEIIKVDFEIKNCTHWAQNMSIVNNYTDELGRIILIGDAAHQLIPSGGFGMNLGINDAYSLYWRLHYLLNNQSLSEIDKISVISSYEVERKLVANYFIKLAGEAYDAGKHVPAIMGYNVNFAKQLLNTAKIFTSTDNIEKIFNLGTIFTNYITGNSIISGGINNRANEYLSDVNCAIRLAYPAADLSYQFLYEKSNNLSTCKILLNKYYTKVPIGLKTPTYAWRNDLAGLIGRRIPHFWIYHQINTRKTDIFEFDKQIIRLSTIDFTSITNAPTFVCLSFTENSQLSFSSESLNHETLFHVVWSTNNCLDVEDHIKIFDNPLQRLTSGDSFLYSKLIESEMQYLNVFSNKSTLEQFKRIANLQSLDKIKIVIRPDGIVSDIL